MTPFHVTSPDGLTLAAAKAGNPNGPEILFIHGLFQSLLSFRPQLTDPALTAEFNMAAWDMRGHGGSDKPLAKSAYLDDKSWADEVAAVIKAAGFKRPVLVGWSFGGRVVTDYVRAHGQDGIAGINFVCAATKADAASRGPGHGPAAGMFSRDLVTNINATRSFVRSGFARQPSQDDFEINLAFNMLPPIDIRDALIARPANPGNLLPTLRVPVLVTHGDRDELILPLASEYIVSQVPGAKLSIYKGIGHTPFAEDAPRFNRELAEFVRACR